MRHSGGCGQERLWVASVWQQSPSRLVTLIFLHYVIRMIILPPICLKTHFRSNLSEMKQLSLVCLAKSSQRISLPWMLNSDVEYLNEHFLSLYAGKRSAASSIPSSSTSSPQHGRRSPCQQHHQPIVGKSPWNFSRWIIWRCRGAPATPRRSFLGACASRGWDVQMPAWDGGAWSRVVSARTAQGRLSLLGGLYYGLFPKKLQTESIKVLAFSVPHCRKKGQTAQRD